MKLNPDCVRDILIAVEETTDNSTSFSFSKSSCISNQRTNVPNLSKYTEDEVEYHIMQCKMNGLFIACSKNILGVIKISGLSPKGYEFLAQIRDNAMWNKVKKAALNVGTGTLGLLIETAKSIMVAYLSGKMI